MSPLLTAVQLAYASAVNGRSDRCTVYHTAFNGLTMVNSQETCIVWILNRLLYIRAKCHLQYSCTTFAAKRQLLYFNCRHETTDKTSIISKIYPFTIKHNVNKQPEMA